MAEANYNCNQSKDEKKLVNMPISIDSKYVSELQSRNIRHCFPHVDHIGILYITEVSGVHLQFDCTVLLVMASKNGSNFFFRRVLFVHLKVNSPFKFWFHTEEDDAELFELSSRLE